MIKFFIAITCLTIAFCFFQTANNTPNSYNNIDNILNIKIEKTNFTEHKGLVFKYELIDTNVFRENSYLKIKCTLTNETDVDVNFLCQSCNGLEYYLVSNPKSYVVMPLMHCNATWPMIVKLPARDSLMFRTQILKLKDSEPLENIGLDFRIVDKFIPFDTLREHPLLVEKIYRAKTEEKNIIWNKN